jgi:ABC-type multidrug transport system fused ATPase/permease subunit
MRIPKPRGIWNSSVFLLYREYGKSSIIYAILASLIGVVSAAISQIQQISFGLIVEILGGEEESSAFPFADLILPSGKQESLVFLIVLIGVVYIYTNFSSIVSSYLWSKFKQEFINKIRVAAYSATQKLSPDKFVQRGTGEYTSLVINDTRQLGRLPQDVLSGGLNNIVRVSTMGVVLITLNWQFALVTLFMVPLIIWWTPKYGDFVKELYKEEREAKSSVTGRITSSIEGVFTVKSYAAEER